MIYNEDKNAFYNALAEISESATNREIAELLLKAPTLSYSDLYDIVTEFCEIDQDFLGEVMLRLNDKDTQ